MKLKMLQNEKGTLALDFLFAFVLMFGFTLILMSVALTLSAVEMTQYLTFASARSYLGAHISREDQSDDATAKYSQLLTSPAYAFIRRGSWFEVFPTPYLGNAANNPQLQGYQQSNDLEPNLFVGAVTYFTAKILDQQIPFFGTTAPSGDGTGSGFGVHIGTYLGREPTSLECIDFVRQRWKAIRQIAVEGGASGYNTGTDEGAYTTIVDNGC